MRRYGGLVLVAVAPVAVGGCFHGPAIELGAFIAEANHLPEQVRSWFLPSVAQADGFYVAEPFDDSFSTFNRAILCYSEKTGIACFYWSGLD